MMRCYRAHKEDKIPYKQGEFRETLQGQEKTTWSEGMRKAKHRKDIPEAKTNTKTPAEVWVLWFWKPHKEDGFLSVMVGLDQASEWADLQSKEGDCRWVGGKV